MKKIINWLGSWFFPKNDADVEREIDSLNISNIHYVSIAVGIVQLVSIIVFFFTNRADIGSSEALGGIVRVGLSVVMCTLAFFVSGVIMKYKDSFNDHRFAIKLFIGSYIVMLVLWGMYASIHTYMRNEQILTFYTVELIVVLLVKLHPMFTSTVILISYFFYYLVLNYGLIPGMINPYNYAMLAVLSAVGAVMNYRITARYIAEKNKANQLNDSLEIIANHDSITRLQNRYALNQRVPEYVGREICVAMGDLNHFKTVNDTYGHQAGDDLLKAFSDILLRHLPKETAYRYGGDEFLIVMQGDDLEGFRATLERVSDEFAEKHDQGRGIGLGCSFGCVQARPESPTDFFDMLLQADRELYQEKSKLKSNRINEE